MICHGAGVKNKTLSDLVLKWEYKFQKEQGKEHFWQHFNILRNMYNRSLLLSFRLEFINAKGELQVNNQIYNKSRKIILDQIHFSADCWFTGNFKSHWRVFWTCGNRHRHHVEVGRLNFPPLKIFSKDEQDDVGQVSPKEDFDERLNPSAWDR